MHAAANNTSICVLEIFAILGILGEYGIEQRIFSILNVYEEIRIKLSIFKYVWIFF